MPAITIDTPALHDVPETQREEAKAIQLALEGSSIARIGMALKALHKLRKDTNDTKQVFTFSIAVSAHYLPTLLMRFLSHDRGLELMTRDATIDTHSVDYDALRALPAGTLGEAYARFMGDNGLTPDLFQAPPLLPRGIAFVMKRMRQTHDLWHVLTGYETDIPGEIQLLAFTYGQTGAPSMRYLASFGALRYSLVHPGILKKAWRAYRRGCQAEFMPNRIWEDMWQRPLAEVQSELGLAA